MTRNRVYTPCRPLIFVVDRYPHVEDCDWPCLLTAKLNVFPGGYGHRMNSNDDAREMGIVSFQVTSCFPRI